jgi:glycyl-tRNA synthetase
VTHLVESPTVLLGKFDPEHLSLPHEALEMVMKKHQRYFPVWKGAELLPYFIVVRNGGEESADMVIEGNENVLRARFADAAFFYSEDLKKKLEDHLPKLETLAFQADLGSMADKTRRITGLVRSVSKMMGLSDKDTSAAKRAAELCKADLVTKLVVEMTSLQGTMGKIYAEISGESKETALAIKEHYFSSSAEDAAGISGAGLAVGIADRLDSLAGLFAIGVTPTGAKDPFALRRAAISLVQNLIGTGRNFDINEGLQEAAKLLPVEASPESLDQSLNFIVDRLKNIFLESGYKYDVVDAVLSEQGHDPKNAKKAIEQLMDWTARGDWDEILPAYSRCVRITRSQEQEYSVDEKLLKIDAEKDLFAELVRAESISWQVGDVDDVFNAFIPMIPAINKFFDDVLVMDEDKAIQHNRLGLLQRISALAAGTADLSHLEGF